MYGSKALRGGPLDAVLNQARYKPDEICATDAVPPELVILRYQHFSREFIVDLGGCPGVVLDDGVELSFRVSSLHRASLLLRSVLPVSHPYCWPSGCATVTGQVKECGGPTSICRVVGFVQVALLDPRGRLVTAEHSGTTGPRLRRFSLLLNGSGTYTVATNLIGERATRKVRVRRGHTTHVNLVIPIR